MLNYLKALRSRLPNATNRKEIRREYLKTAPSLAERLFFGLSIRPDITNDKSQEFIKDAEWAVFDAWVDVGHAMSDSMRTYSITHGLQAPEPRTRC